MTSLAPSNYNIEEIRKDFPIFNQKIYGKPLTFLDSGASAQKPQRVLDAIQKCYAEEYANIHRGGILSITGRYPEI